MKFRYLPGMCICLLLVLGPDAAAQNVQKLTPLLTIRLLTTDIQVAADGSNTQMLHAEVRANNDAAALQVGQTSTSYDASTQEISVVDARTLKADGKVLQVDPSAVYDQTPPGQSGLLVTGIRSKLIVFPQFVAGDTAVYTIKIVTRKPSFEKQFFHGEFFPRTVAYDEVRETVTAPKGFPLFVESHDVQASRQEEGGNVKYEWHYSAPKPLAEEPVTFSPLEHTPRFFISSFKDYAQMGRAYAALAEPKRLVTPKIQALANEITAGTSDQKAQAQKLYEWVSSHIRYVAILLGDGSFVPHDVDMIVANGYGDCKDHDLILKALLKAKGIEARSILLNGGDSYMMTEVPTFTTLNHVITFLPQFNIYLDSTAAVAPFGILPLNEYGKPMVVASATAPELGKMPVLPPGVAKTAIKTVSVMDGNGMISGTTTTSGSGPYAITLRTIGLGIQTLGPAAAVRLLTVGGLQNPSGTISQTSPTGFGPDYSITTTFKASGWNDEVSGKSSFHIPPGMRLLGLAGDNVMGPFDPGNLRPGEPTLCFSAQQSEDFSLKSPPGYQFLGLPSNVRVETPNLLFVAQWSVTGDVISVHRDFTSKIDQVQCSGIIRTQSAAALKQISESYQANIAFAKRTRDGGDAQANAALPYYNSGYSHLNAGRYELAIADLDKAISLAPDDFDSYGARGSAYSHLEKYERAIEDYDKSIGLNKENGFQIFNLRGWAHMSLGQLDLAVADYSKAIELKADNIEGYSGRGEAYSRAGKLDASIVDLNRVLALDPDGPFSYNAYYSRAYARMKSYPDLAMADINKAVVLQPRLFNPYRLRAMIKMSSRRYADAIADLNKALALKPDDIDLLGDRGFANFQVENHKQAIADYDRVIAKKPDAAAALFYRGGAKTKVGEKKEGDRDIVAAIKLDPSLGK